MATVRGSSLPGGVVPGSYGAQAFWVHATVPPLTQLQVLQPSVDGNASPSL